MRGYSLIELIVGLVILLFAMLIFFVAVDQALRAFSKVNQTFNETAEYFNAVTSNFAGQLSGSTVNTLDKVLGYQLTGPYAFFDSIEVRIKDGKYLYGLQDITF